MKHYLSNNKYYRTLKDHEYSNAVIGEKGRYVALMSYSTTIVIVDKVNKTITVTGLYSMTTIKHMGWFMREMVEDGLFPSSFNYFTLKQAMKLTMYSETGEIKDLEDGWTLKHDYNDHDFDVRYAA